MTKIKDKEKILKGKATTSIQGNIHRLSVDFSAETLQARREWHDIFKVMKKKNLQPRILHPASLSFKLI